MNRNVNKVVMYLVVAISIGVAEDKFKPVCSNPRYPSPARSGLTIDADCVIQGASKEVDDNPAEGEQNKAKNNFCAEDPANPVTTADMKALQTQVQQDHSINFGKKEGPTKDREKLRTIDSKLGEGKLAVFTGYVLIARQESAESVNCELGPKPKAVKGKPKPKPNPADDLLHDIHISLVDSKTTKNECQSIVAEMSPHHRPDTWTEHNVTKVSRAGLQVRVTGQLFFDSAHDLPCVGGNPPAKPTGNPVRLALWEIHPIYKFEVNDKGNWKDLSDWVNGK